MHRDAKIALGILALVFTVACLLPCILTSLPVEDNSVGYFRTYYGTSKEDLEAVGRAYGVELDDFSDYGPQPFPINYIVHALGQDQPEPPKVSRADVNSVVTGYVSKCELSDTNTIYLFYSDRLGPKSLIDGEALIMSILYKLDSAQAGIRDGRGLQSIQWYIVGDSGGWDWERVAPQCDPPARYVSCLQFFGYCIRILH